MWRATCALGNDILVVFSETKYLRGSYGTTCVDGFVGDQAGRKGQHEHASVVRPVTHIVTLMVLSFDSLVLPFSKDIFCENIRRERNNCDTKAWEEVGKHSAVGEHGMFPPSVALCPRVK